MNREPQPHPTESGNAGEHHASADVPVFNCLIYIASTGSGGVRARVANLAGLECQASSEREALSQLVPAFKQRLAESAARNEPIAWLDPPAPATDAEQQRWIPVHL